MLLAFGLALAVMQAASPEQPSSLALALTPGQTFQIEHVDVRALPGGGQARFRQQHRLTVESRAEDNSGYIVTYRALAASCEGPEALCSAFRQALGPPDAVPHRLLLARDGDVVLLDPSPLSVDPGSSGGAIITAREASEPGSLLAADLRLLTRFANLPFSAMAAPIAMEEGILRVTMVDDARLAVAIDRPPLSAPEGPVIESRAECSVTRRTGLVEHCRMTDRLVGNDPQLIRAREIFVRVELSPVS